MRMRFRPDTRLDVYDSLEATIPIKRGSRAVNSPLKYPLSWVVLDLKEGPCPEDCCNGVSCNPSLQEVLSPCTKEDPRLHAYKQDFIQLKIDREADTFDAGLCSDSNVLGSRNPPRPASAMSNSSKASSSTVASKRGRGTTLVEKQRLSEMLVEWRKSVCADMGSDFWTSEMVLPNGHVKKMMEKSYIFLCEENITRAQLTEVVKLDLASRDHFIGLLAVLRRWGQEVRQQETPSKTQGCAKRTRNKSPIKKQSATTSSATTLNTATSGAASMLRPSGKNILIYYDSVKFIALSR